MKNQWKRALLAAAALTLAGGPLLAQAQASSTADYPNRAVTIIVPFPAGGASDLLARQLGKQLSQVLGQPFIVDNRAGAGGVVGARLAARAEPNGYTLVMGTNASHAISATLRRDLGYDPVKDFAPISLVARVPQLLMVHPDLPINNVGDLVQYSRKHPNTLNFGSAGTGTPGHLGMELFKIMANADMTHVPFQGGNPALLALAGGQVQVVADNVSSALPQVKSGKVKAIAVTSMQRSAAMPQLQTIDQQGIKGFDSGSWFALLAPAGTPPAIVAKLNAETIKALRNPEVQATLTAQGAEPDPGPPAALTALIQSDIEKWSAVVRQIGLKME